MRIDQLTDVGSDALTADLVIVGSGPAGLTLARELGGVAARVLLLESGGLAADPSADALNEIESVGAARVMDQREVRNRVLGGTSATWSGRAVQLDEIDFADRPWVRDSGWPIARSDLEPFFARAAEHLGAAVPDNAQADLVGRVTADLPPVDPAQLRPYAWVLSQDAANPGESMRFGPRALTEALPSVQVLLGATVLEVRVDDAGEAVTGLVVAGADGVRRTIRTDRVVLAAGGIENARLLLASSSTVPEGLGNRHDLVGRYLMDHLRGPVAVVDPRDHAALQHDFGDRYVAEGGRATPGWALSPALQERESLTNCAAWLFPVVSELDPFTAVRGARRAPAQAASAAARHPAMLARGLARMRLGHAAPARLLDRLELHVIVEQAPDRDSRVTLADRTDRLGMPLSRIDWRIGEQEVRTARRTARLAADALQRAGRRPLRLLPLLEEGAPFDLPDVAHPIGTTRMSADPEHGVVDPRCAVHGVRGLWIAGSSVFPTSAHANPTGAVVALAVRLADDLRRILRGG
ncbi:GMC oxidoreductase [uncultured Amnibacterium sp.]|uniref:GMC oxidoreductase n=1 Tax=uncultured Amnibacterium sp. TaxID=1631851 RepID=UPI0035C959A3